MSQSPKKIIITYEKVEYIWHNKTWITKKFMTVSTSLAQQLTEYALKNGLISENDINNSIFKEEDYKEVPKIKAKID